MVVITPTLSGYEPPRGIHGLFINHAGCPLALVQAHTQTKQSLQITLHKHALEFEHVRDYLLSHVNSQELT